MMQFRSFEGSRIDVEEFVNKNRVRVISVTQGWIEGKFVVWFLGVGCD